MARMELAPSAPALKIDELLARCVGNLAFAQRILRRFEDCFTADLDRLDRYWQEGHAGELARLAHTMKGAAANVAAPQLTALLAEIEELARRNAWEALGARLPPLRSEWSRVAESIAAMGTAPARRDCT